MSFTLSKKLDDCARPACSPLSASWPSCSSKLLLLARNLRGGHDPHADVEIALAAVRIRQPLALLAENLPRLRAFGNFEILLALQRGNLDRWRPAPPAESSPESCSTDPRRAARKTDAPSLREKCRDRPAGPPFVPGSPCPGMRSRVPESTPAGTPTSRTRSRSTRPCPRQEAHASRITCPVPWHAGHVRVIEKNPCW